jgi:hydrogenase expression/formation protein HypC
MRIKSIVDDTAICEMEGIRREASLMLVEDARVGDFVLIHAGFAMEKLDPAEAETTLALFRQLLADAPDAP